MGGCCEPWEGRPPSRRVRLIGTSVDALPNSRNLHDEVPSTVVANHAPSLPSTIPASSTVLREVHPKPHGRCSVLSGRVDSDPENLVDPTVLDSVEGVVDHRRMPDTDSDSTESVHFVDEVFGRGSISVRRLMSRKSRFHCPGPRRMFVDGLRSLDGVGIRQIFRRRALVMKSVPKFMQGSFRAVLKAIMEESAARLARDVLRQSRAWKTFLLLPLLLLNEPPRGGLIQKKRLEERLEFFARGNWLPLLRASEQCGSWFPYCSKESKTTRDHIGQAGSLGFGIGSELSSGRQALEGAELATLVALTNPDRRPAEPREPLPPQLVNRQVEFVLSLEGLCKNLRTSRRVPRQVLLE